MLYKPKFSGNFLCYNFSHIFPNLPIKKLKTVLYITRNEGSHKNTQQSCNIKKSAENPVRIFGFFYYSFFTWFYTTVISPWDKSAQRSLATERKQWGVGGEPEVINLVYTKRRKDIYANRKHETTLYLNVPLVKKAKYSSTRAVHAFTILFHCCMQKNGTPVFLQIFRGVIITLDCLLVIACNERNDTPAVALFF